MSEIQILVNDQVRTVSGQTWFSLDEVITFFQNNYITFFQNNYAVDSIIRLVDSKLPIEDAMMELSDGFQLTMFNKNTGEFDLIELLPEMDEDDLEEEDLD